MMDGWDVIEEAAELSRRGEQFAMATVVWRQAPSSGQQGARAIITADGQLHGWIGGACAEPAVIREAQRIIGEGVPRLLLLGTAEQFGSAVPDGMTVIPISCQSEGALEVFIEPVIATLHVVVVGRSPMAHTLVEIVGALGWRADLVDVPDFSGADLDARSVVVIATQGHGDEEAVTEAVAAKPAFIGLVASRKRAATVLGYLADRGIERSALDRVHAPVGLDLGHTSHREIAVAILAELVQLRATGALLGGPGTLTPNASTMAAVTEAFDPVCGMRVRADRSSHPVEHDGTTYYFCSVGCRDVFAEDPDAIVSSDYADRGQ